MFQATIKLPWRLAQWSVGIGLYLTARLVLVNLFKTLAFVGLGMWLSFFHSSLHAAEKVEHVYDHAQVLTEKQADRLQQLLSEFALKKQSDIVIILTKDKHFYQDLQNLPETRLIWIVNLATKESALILPKRLQSKAELPKAIATIQQEIIDPYLAASRYYRMAVEGSIALETVMVQSKEPTLKTRVESTYIWLGEHQVFKYLKLLLWLVIAGGLVQGFKRFMARPRIQILDYNRDDMLSDYCYSMSLPHR